MPLDIIDTDENYVSATVINRHSSEKNSTSTSNCTVVLNLCAVGEGGVAEGVGSDGGRGVRAKTAHEGNVARPRGRSQLDG